MKRILSLALSAAMVLSSIPFAYATNSYEQGTEVIYTAANNENWTITVPAKLNPGKSGTVTLDGYWPSNKTITVDADDTVVLKNSILQSDTKILNITFPGITKLGNNIERSTASETVSVQAIDNALFGTWSGVFYYEVETSDAVATGCDTLAWDGDTANCVEAPWAYGGNFYQISNTILNIEDCQNGVDVVFADESWSYTYKDLQDQLETYGFICGEEDFVVVPYDNYVYQIEDEVLISFPKAGIYFLFENENNYVKSITLPGYTGFNHFAGCPHDTADPAGGCDTIRKDTIIALGKEQGTVEENEYRTEGWVKVSNEVFTAEQIQHFVLRYYDYDAEEVVTASIGAYPSEGMIALGDTRNGTAIGMCILEDVNNEDISISAGFYLMYGDCVVYFDSLTIPGYTGFNHTQDCNHDSLAITETALKFNQPYKMQYAVNKENAVGVKEYIFHEDGTIDVYDYIEPIGENTAFYGGDTSVIQSVSCRYTENEIYVYGELWATIGENGEYINKVIDNTNTRCELVAVEPHGIYFGDVYNYMTYGRHNTAIFSENGEFTLYEDGVAFRTYYYSCDDHIITIKGNIDDLTGQWVGRIYPDGTKVTFSDTLLFLN